MAQRTGFSLIELLVAVTVIAILASLLMPVVRQVCDAAQRTRCLGNLRQVGLAVQAYLGDCAGWYPTSRQDGIPGAYGTYVHWFEHLLPYMEAAEKTGNGTLDRRDLAAGGRTIFTDCPAWKATTVWAFGYGFNGCLRTPERPHRSYWDTSTGYYLDYRAPKVTSLAERVLVGDSPDWHVTVDNAKYPTRWSPRRHGATANYVFCDGHARSLPPASAALAISDPAHAP